MQVLHFFIKQRDSNSGSCFIVILDIVSKIMISNYRNSIDIVIIVWYLAVNLLNKFLKHLRRGIIVIATYMEKALTSIPKDVSYCNEGNTQDAKFCSKRFGNIQVISNVSSSRTLFGSFKKCTKGNYDNVTRS